MIILMGVAGAGKSMQGRLFADEHGLAWISTGELLRVLVTGKRRQEMLEGKLLTDEEMSTMLDKVLDLINLSEEFVLDGFPRTIPQAEWLLNQVERGRFDVTAVFNLVASTEIVRERLQARGRVDDTEQAINQRFEEYDTITRPIIELLKQHGLPVYDIDASQTPEKVHDTILGYVNALDKR
jgi:adenylate kinase